MYSRLTDPTAKETAREMTIRKRTAKAQAAFDRGLHNHARWHLKEIAPLLKPEETDPSMQNAKEAVEDLNAKLQKEPTTKTGN